MAYQKDIHEEYDKQLEKILSSKFKGKTVEQIANMPVEAIKIKESKNTVFEKSKTKINKKLNSVHKKIKQQTQKEGDNIDQMSEVDKQIGIDTILAKDTLSISTLQRHFCISFPKAADIVDNLLEQSIIKKLDVGYQILDKQKLQHYFQEIFKK